MRNKLILGLMVIAVIVIGAGLLLKTTVNKTTGQTQTQKQTQNNNTLTKQKVISSYVNVTATGFEPQSLTIKKGTRVVWINKSGKDVTVNSDMYPTNTIWPFLNLGKFSNKSSVSVVFEKTGKYTYHNHYSPGQKGTVIVK